MAADGKSGDGRPASKLDEPRVVKLETSMRRSRKAKAVWARVAVVLFLMLVFSSIFMLNTELFRVKFVEITGTKRVSASDVDRMAGIDMRKNIFMVNAKDVAESLLQNPLIKKVSVKRIVPSKIKIIVYERQPFAYFKIGQRFFVIDDERYVLQIDKSPVDKSLKTISSDSAAAVDVGRKIEFPREDIMARFVRSAEQKLGKNFDSVRFNRDGITIILKNGAYVQMGSGEDMEEKLRFIPLVVSSLEKGGHKYEGINLKSLAVPTFIPKLTAEEKARLEAEQKAKEEAAKPAAQPATH